MKTINVGLIGFGTVGKGVVKTLLSKKKILRDRTGVNINIVKIADKDIRAKRGVYVPRKLLTKDVYSVVKDRNIDIIVELIGGIHPAKEIILKALTLGKHVVTANKALLAEHGKEIFTVASRFRSFLGFEASVGGGIPIINALRTSFVSNRVEVIYGILNGTSNFILSRMYEKNCTFKEALNEASSKGIAEKNPKLDINGIDSSHKLAILALLGFGKNVRLQDIYVEGIEGIAAMDIEYAGEWGYVVKLLAIAKKIGNELDLRVHPTLIPARSVLASVKEENNAIFIKGDMVGDAILYGKGAGSLPAASSVVGDIAEIASNINGFKRDKAPFKLEFNSGIKRIRKINNLNTRYYLRFSAIDRPGVLAGVSSILAKNRISIATVTQKERKKRQTVPIVMLTHGANEGKMDMALKKIDKLPFITKKNREDKNREVTMGVIERYKKYLPITDKTPIISLNEGNTPLVRANYIERLVGENIKVYLKYEGLNPTSSFKDRGMTLAVSKAVEEGSRSVICASTGNTAASAACYAARAKIKCVVLIPEGSIALGKLAQALIHGAQVIAVKGNFDDCLKLVREITEKYPITLVNSLNPNRIEGQKTGAFEICDALGAAPDYHAIPVGNAGNITAYWKGYKEYKEAGKINSLPKMIGFQAEGASPIVKKRIVKDPKTIATAIKIGNPANWKKAEAARDESGGLIESVTDEQILTAYKILASKEGVFVEPASAASVAGVLKKAKEGYFRAPERRSTRAPELRIVCVLTGHGLKDPDRAIASVEKPKVLPAKLENIVKEIGF